ncbi:MAG: hypothetical protein NTV22_18685 [bacterium]|nr:hypothetical protein [bacterium]
MSDLLILFCAAALVGVAPLGAAAPSAATSGWQRLNALFGAPLFQDTILWNDADAAAAERLGLALESRTAQQASFRAYPDATARLLGARPYSVALYGTSGQVAYLSIMFANKGDVEGLSVGGDRDASRADARLRKKALQTYQDKIRADATTIEATLTKSLGTPTQVTFGEGSRDTTERALRWNAGVHSILLSSPKDEYVAVRIVPRALADAEGRAQRIDDATLRATLATRVQRRANGDVIIGDIPMVDQGPKGFCVPATWERYLRYLGIPADMYVLAMAGGTMAGGGTSLTEMEGNVKKLVTRYGRQIVTVRKMPKTRFIQEYIDKGIPLMWTLVVPRDFYMSLTARAEERRKVTDWTAWKKQLQAQRVSADSLRKRADGGHICLIIGYNKTTGEIATSDSWGKGFEERWMTEAEAAAIGAEYLTAITW